MANALLPRLNAPPSPRDALEGGEVPPPPEPTTKALCQPPPPRAPSPRPPLSPWQQVPASMAFVTDSNRHQPLWQPPPTPPA